MTRLALCLTKGRVTAQTPPTVATHTSFKDVRVLWNLVSTQPARGVSTRDRGGACVDSRPCLPGINPLRVTWKARAQDDQRVVPSPLGMGRDHGPDDRRTRRARRKVDTMFRAMAEPQRRAAIRWSSSSATRISCIGDRLAAMAHTLFSVAPMSSICSSRPIAESTMGECADWPCAADHAVNDGTDLRRSRSASAASGSWPEPRARLSAPLSACYRTTHSDRRWPVWPPIGGAAESVLALSSRQGGRPVNDRISRSRPGVGLEAARRRPGCCTIRIGTYLRVADYQRVSPRRRSHVP
jgi:hypothetical protein